MAVTPFIKTEQPTMANFNSRISEINDALSTRATTAVYGTTKLSTSTISASKTTAATPYAVKTALDKAKQYTDTAIGNAIAASY